MGWLEDQLKISTLDCLILCTCALSHVPCLFCTCRPVLALREAHTHYQTWLPPLTSFNYVKLHFAHQRLSNCRRPYFFYIRGSRKCNFFWKIFRWQLLSSYVLPDFYVVKIFVLKYFCRTSTLRKFFNMKNFPTKTKIFQFTVSTKFVFIKATLVLWIWSLFLLIVRKK